MNPARRLPRVTSHSRTLGETLLRAGLAITTFGLVCTLIAILPLFWPSLTMSGVWWFLAMLTGVGLIVIIAGLVTSGRDRRMPSDQR